MALFPIRFIPEKPEIRFIKQSKFSFALSIIAVVATIFLLATKGLNFGIDFTGGVVIEIKTDKAVPLSNIRSTLQDIEGVGEISLQHFGSDNDVMIRFQPNANDNKARITAINNVKAALNASIDQEITYRKTEYVGPQVGEELIQAGVLSLLLAIAAILVYIWLRFEWQFGAGAVVALTHDAILTLGFFSLLGIEFNLTSIAAILTIIGYSINDSVVIYDRIRDNLRKYKKRSLEEVLDLSLNETLSRTLLTAGTTILALIALSVFGGLVIRGFSLAVLVGIIAGTYSSIYLAAPLLTTLGVRKKSKASE
jgi:preprotein translocase subunit SecF